ncbi:substrate-binding periplasmic protein [Methylobacterium radiodurans]|uniref:Amino acid ABC transporter substrate-binding protein n=1 Tax=Methylobacterium radiodurans TaxID=2202828 RepID=A0A2U8VPD7_9HYPH|nr:transporter substrate-binding domain-containing protein [Methylobacterium radiodurans]AWN35252.1 amino acid ABC transporter substrate-binding protein [Methylobacterium radiodurans]
MQAFRLVLALAVGLIAPTGATARPFDEVVASGVLRVAVYDDNAPFSDAGAAAPRGIDADLARAIAERLKLTLDLRVVDAGENVDGDFRLNLWRGDLTGTPLADLMLNVPHDRILATRNEQIFLTTPYFEQRLAFAYRKDRIEGLSGVRNLDGHTVAVEGTSASDSLLMNAEGGRFRDAVRHFRSFDEAAKAYLAGETAILAGTRASIEAALRRAGAAGADNPVVEVPIPGLVRTRWDLGGAVRSDSRDLAYAVGDALTALAQEGRLKVICESYGVTYTAPQGY